MKYSLIFLLFLVVITDGLFSNDQSCYVVKIESLSEIPDSHSTQTLYFFDIDETLFNSPSMLGSKTWRKYISEKTKEADQNWHDIFTLLFARKHPVIAVEDLTAEFVQDLQMKGHAVFGLTARERNKWYDTPAEGIDQLTIQQLASVGINFSNRLIEETYPDLVKAPEYFEGVFFSDIEPKGEYLLKLFKSTSHYPEKIIFIDDKLSQAESVSRALNQLGIKHECYWYTFTDKAASQFDPLVADIQLYYFWTSGGTIMLSDLEAASIAEQCSGPEVEEYCVDHWLFL